MRWLLIVLLGMAFLVGCSTTKQPALSGKAEGRARSSRSSVAANASQQGSSESPTIVLDNSEEGTVASVNGKLRFVVLDFSLSRLPQVGQQLSVYHQGKKVGELRVTGPVQNDNIVADLVAGTAQAGDLVRPD